MRYTKKGTVRLALMGAIGFTLLTTPIALVPIQATTINTDNIEALAEQMGYDIDITPEQVQAFTDELQVRDVDLSEVGEVMGNDELDTIIEKELGNIFVRAFAQNEYDKVIKNYRASNPIESVDQGMDDGEDMPSETVDDTIDTVETNEISKDSQEDTVEQSDEEPNVLPIVGSNNTPTSGMSGPLFIAGVAALIVAGLAALLGRFRKNPAYNTELKD